MKVLFRNFENFDVSLCYCIYDEFSKNKLKMWNYQNKNNCLKNIS